MSRRPCEAPTSQVSDGRLTILRLGVMRLGWDLPIHATATGVDQLGRFLVNLLAAATLAPAVLAQWVVMSLLLQYSQFTSLGVGNGLSREVPQQLGDHKEAEAAKLEDVALTATLATSVAAALLAGLMLPFLAGPGTEALAPAFAVAMLLQPVFQLEQGLARARLRFRALAVQLSTQGVVALAVGAWLLVFGAGVVGILFARIAAYAVAVALAPRTLARVPRPGWNRELITRLIAVGFPLMTAGMLLTALLTLDRWLVGLWLGRHALGLYGLVGFGISALLFFPTVVSQQYYPRLALAKGRGQGAGQLLRLSVEQSHIALALTALAATGILATASAGIPAFMPDYVPAIGPLWLATIGTLAYAAGSPYGNLLSLTGHQRTYVAVQLISLLLEVLLVSSLLLAGLGLEGAAAGVMATMFAYAWLLRRAAKRRLEQQDGSLTPTSLRA